MSDKSITPFDPSFPDPVRWGAKRIVCHFSCGAASAVATKLAIADNGGVLPLEIIYCQIAEEHPDNARFLADCEEWFGVSVTILRNEKYNSSIIDTFLLKRFISNRTSAACTRELKKIPSEAFSRFGDVDVFGFTREEAGRLARMEDANNAMRPWAPLVDRQISKGEALAMIERAGIKLPAMYGLGYDHNNCVGCVKGGMGYWNKIRVDFPEAFERMAKVQDALGEGSYFFRDGRHAGARRIGLRELRPDQGNMKDEPKIQCGAACELAERSYARNGA